MMFGADINRSERYKVVKAERLVLKLTDLVIDRPFFWRLRAGRICKQLKRLAASAEQVQSRLQQIQLDSVETLKTAILPELVHYGAVGAATNFLRAGALPSLNSLAIPAVTMLYFDEHSVSNKFLALAEAIVQSVSKNAPHRLCELAPLVNYIKTAAEKHRPGIATRTFLKWPRSRIKGPPQAIPNTPEAHHRLALVLLALVKSNRLLEAQEIFKSTETRSNSAPLLAECVVNAAVKTANIAQIFNCESQRDLARWKTLIVELNTARPGALGEILIGLVNKTVNLNQQPDFPFKLFAAAAAGLGIGCLDIESFTGLAERAASGLLQSWRENPLSRDEPLPAYSLSLAVIADLAPTLPDRAMWAAATIVRSFSEGNLLHAILMTRIKSTPNFSAALMENGLLKYELAFGRFDRLRPIFEILSNFTPSKEVAEVALAELSFGLFSLAEQNTRKLESRESAAVVFAINTALWLGANPMRLGKTTQPIFVELLLASRNDSERPNYFIDSAVCSWLATHTLGANPTFSERLLFEGLLPEFVWIASREAFPVSAPKIFAALKLLVDLTSPTGTGEPMLDRLGYVTQMILSGDTDMLRVVLNLTETHQYNQTIRKDLHVNEAEFLVIFAAALIKGDNRTIDIASELITAVHRWEENDLLGMPRKLGELYGHCGVLAHSFRRWKFIFKTYGDTTIGEEYGFLRIEAKGKSDAIGFKLSEAGRKNTRPRLVFGSMHTLSTEAECLFTRGFLLIRNQSGCLLIKNASKTFGRDIVVHTAYFSASFVGSLEEIAENYSESFLRGRGFVSITRAPRYETGNNKDKPVGFLSKLEPLVMDLELICANIDAWLFDTDRETAWMEDPLDAETAILTGAHNSQGFSKLLRFLASHNEHHAPLKMAFFNPSLPPLGFHLANESSSKESSYLVLDSTAVSNLSALASGENLSAANSTVRFINEAGLMKQGAIFIFDSID